MGPIFKYPLLTTPSNINRKIKMMLLRVNLRTVQPSDNSSVLSAEGKVETFIHAWRSGPQSRCLFIDTRADGTKKPSVRLGGFPPIKH